MKDMAETIKELRDAAAAINDAGTWLTEHLVGKQLRDASGTISEVANRLEEQFAAEAAPAEPVLTLETVRAVLAEKSRAGFTAQIRALLLKYGADKLSAIAPENYKALMAEAEALRDAG